MAIYFVSDGQGHIKIGYSSGDVGKRIAQLQVSSPMHLSCIAVLPGTQKLENELHRRFKSLRIRGNGEWFREDREILDYVGIHDNDLLETDIDFLEHTYGAEAVDEAISALSAQRH